MKKLILSICSFIVISTSSLVYAATFETLTVGTATAVGFTSSKLTERTVSSAFITIESNDIRILYGTSTVPTSSAGLYFPKNTSFRLDNQRHLETFKCIAISGTSTVSVLYEP